MALTVKKKIWLGTLFLFILLILTGGTAIYYTAKIKSDTKNVLRDNYESLSYCHAMQQQLIRPTADKTSIDLNAFDKILKNEERNITEEGEGKSGNYFKKLFFQTPGWRYNTTDDQQD